MEITNIEMISFRNHTKKNFSFNAGLTIIWGENGSGKTSILEAIHSLSLGKSFRTNNKKELIKKGKESFFLRGFFTNDNGVNNTVSFFQGARGNKKIKINEKFLGVSFAEFLEGKNDTLKDKEYTFSETGALHGPYPSPEISNVFCIKSVKYKLIYLKDANKWELYNLIDDPKEQHNIYGTKLIVENKLKEKLLEWINRH